MRTRLRMCASTFSSSSCSSLSLGANVLARKHLMVLIRRNIGKFVTFVGDVLMGCGALRFVSRRSSRTLELLVRRRHPVTEIGHMLEMLQNPFRSSGGSGPTCSSSRMVVRRKILSFLLVIEPGPTRILLQCLTFVNGVRALVWMVACMAFMAFESKDTMRVSGLTARRGRWLMACGRVLRRLGGTFDSVCRTRLSRWRTIWSNFITCVKVLLPLRSVAQMSRVSCRIPRVVVKFLSRIPKTMWFMKFLNVFFTRGVG